MSQRIELDGPWAAHLQEAWSNDALNPRFPLPLRVAFAAYGQHRANGHARFKQGELCTILGHLDDEGHFVPADRRTVYRAIRQAVDYGLLDPASKTLCLVVPRHRIDGGQGSSDTACARHPKPTRRLRAVV